MVKIVIIVIVVIIVLWIIGTYNKFIKLRTMVEEAFSTMDVYLKKRFDLIPNLVSTVKGYTKHEAETLEKVVAARNSAVQSGNSAEIAKAESEVSGAIRNIFAVAEAYPELKANENFMDLQKELESLEDEIAQSRKYYNGCVKKYNIALSYFPASIIASMGHFEKKDFYEAEESERQNVKVEF